MADRLPRATWEAFVRGHRLLAEVPIPIAQSWERCWTRLDPFSPQSLPRLAERHLLSAQVASFDLLSIARPIMEDIHQFMENSDSIVVLSNNAGYVLDVLGDESLRARLRAQGLSTGVSLSENMAGTNAFALTLIERMPVTVCGAEHYLQMFHDLSDHAAPVFDVSGVVLGSLGVVTTTEHCHPHSLALVAAGARAIEAQRQADMLLAEQNQQLARLNSIMATIDQGIMVWDSNGNLLHINAAAMRLFEISAEPYLGRNIFEHMHLPGFVLDALETALPLDDVEISLSFDERQVSCILSLHYVHGRSAAQSVIAVLRPTREVRRLVQRQFGVRASLTLENLVGRTQEMRRVRRMASTAASARASILIRGESGTGKNFLARAIHNHGSRRGGPFLVFACTAVPTELVITELTGVEDGREEMHGGSRPGKLELADGGTIFFKDIDALTLEAQTILLNFLELGLIQRQGSRAPIELDVRVIAATSADLEERVQNGNFRSDLYYRLSPFEITLPPVRERLEDLPLLIDNLLERLSRTLQHPIHLHPEVYAALGRYPWPGNIRELEAVIERASIQADPAEEITIEHLPAHIVHTPRTTKSGASVAPIEEMERDAILKAAKVYKGNLSAMARALGVGRTTVWRRVRNLGLDIDIFRS